jgi:serine/threonine-protein kinase
LGQWHGQTFRARRESDGLEAALEFVTLDEDTSARFLDIVCRVRGVEHPYLLGVLQAERAAGGVVVATPLSDGGHSLRELEQVHRRDRTAFDRGELLDYIRTGAEGLDFLAGRCSCPHKNVSPDNLIALGRSVRLTRYGYPDAVDLAADTSGAHLVGTQGYLPPERFGSGEATTQGDQFSLAIVYVELRTGGNPLIPNRLAQLSGSEPPDLRGLSAAQRAVVARAVTIDPAARWPSCRAFADALVQAG